MVTTCQASVLRINDQMGESAEDGLLIRWRTERWGALERRLDVRDVEDSGSRLFVILGRLLREGGTGR